MSHSKGRICDKCYCVYEKSQCCPSCGGKAYIDMKWKCIGSHVSLEQLGDLICKKMYCESVEFVAMGSMWDIKINGLQRDDLRVVKKGHRYRLERPA